MDLRTVTLSIPPQEVITRDNVPASVNAVCYFRVVNPNDAIVQVENFLLATSQIAQTTLRAVLGRAELDTLLSERDRLNDELQRIIDEQTEPWGIKVTTVEIKDVEIPQTMQRAMARQAEAERERRAKIIAAEGEFQASEKLAQAAEKIGKHPVAIQLRFLQTLLEVGSERNSTTIFPVPIDLFQPFIEAARQRSRRPGHAGRLSPELRIDPLTGLKVALAPGRATRPDSFEIYASPSGRDRASALSAGPRGLDPSRDLRDPARRRPARLSRLAGAGGPEQVPGAGARQRWSRGAGPARARAAATRSCSPRCPPHGLHEVIVHAPQHLRSMTDLSPEQFDLALEAWRERVAAHADAAYVHLIVNEGPRRGRLARAHPRPALRAAVRPDGRRARAGALHRPQHPHDGRLPPVRSAAGGGAKARARRRRRRPTPCCSRPMPPASPYELQLVPRRHARSFAESEEGAAALLLGGPRSAEAHVRRSPAAEPLAAHRAA